MMFFFWQIHVSVLNKDLMAEINHHRESIRGHFAKMMDIFAVQVSCLSYNYHWFSLNVLEHFKISFLNFLCEMLK